MSGRGEGFESASSGFSSEICYYRFKRCPYPTVRPALLWAAHSSKGFGTQTGGSRLSVSFPSCLCGPFLSRNARPISPTGSPPRSDAPSPEPLIAAQLSVTAYCRPLVVPPRWEASPPGSFLSLVLPTAFAHARPAPERSEPPVDFTSPTKRQRCRVWRRNVAWLKVTQLGRDRIGI